MPHVADFHNARQRQINQDLAVHEVYEVSTSKSSDASSSVPGMPSKQAVEAYTRKLNNPGEIMIHGVLLVVDEKGFGIKCVSDNAKSFFLRDPKSMLGQPMLDMFEERARIESALVMEDLSLANPITCSIKPPDGSKLPGKVNLIVSRNEDGLLIDVEQLPPHENTFAAHQRVRVAIDRLHATDNVHAMTQQVVEEVASTTGYDRVMMYKFHEDMHGEVVSECRINDNLHTLHGFHYPATDLPQRVRDQFKVNQVRYIVDSSAACAKLFFLDSDHTADMVDMSMSSLRRAHDCHLEYMRGMQVAASLVLGVVVKDVLWGLVVCHHATPRFVSYQSRMACEFLAQALSMRLSNLLDTENHHRHDRGLQLNAKLCDLMYQQGHNPGLRLFGLVCSRPSLIDLVPGVNGAACVPGNNKYTSVGVVPADKHMQKLISILKVKMSKLDGGVPFVSNSMITLDPSFEEIQDTTSGVMAVKVDLAMLLWFRPEYVATVRWGGDPSKWVRQDGDKIRPRTSFEAFVRSVRGNCAPWLRWERESAHGLALLVNDMLLASDSDDVRSNVLVRLNDERMQTKGEKDAVVSEMGQLIDSVSAPILAINCSFLIVQWNQTLVETTGMQKEDVIGRPLVQLLDPACCEKVLEELQPAQEGVDVKNIHITLLRDDGMRTDLVINATARKGADGSILGVVCVGQDVTETNMSGGKQRALEDHLQKVVTMTEGLEADAANADEGNFIFHRGKDGSLLGEGQFGKTHRMQSRMDEQLYAVKMIKVKQAEKSGVPVESLKREVQVLLRLQHPSVVRYFTCYMYKSNKFFCIVMELLEGGTLGDLVQQNYKAGTKIDADTAGMYVLQLAEGLAHIHSKKILHRDLKPHNILLNKDRTEAKITDFGLACVVSSAAASSRAGTLNYASPEKAGAKGYNSKDDMWALGCIVAELVMSAPLQSRTGNGILAFNRPMITDIGDDCFRKNKVLGSVVKILLEVDPIKRPSAVEVVDALTPKGSTVDSHEADELCEEYMCPICQNLVLDAHTVCSDEHVFCGTCLKQWLSNKNECPTCRTLVSKPRRLRVINNAVEKLALRVLSDDQKEEREARKQEEHEEEMAALKLEEAKKKTETQRRAAQPDPTPEEGGGVGAWRYALGNAQYGSGCTLLLHEGAGVCIEVFHGNGWFRFKAGPSPQVRWCNSCGNLGDSDFGAPDAVRVLEGGGGETVPAAGLGALDDLAYWESHVQGMRLVLTNTDDEVLVLNPDGTFVWLSHPGMNKAIVLERGNTVATMERDAALALIPGTTV